MTEIMVNGTENIYVERQGRLFQWDRKFSSRKSWRILCSRLWQSATGVANEAVSIVDARLENGARVNVVMAPVAIEGPVITIRRFPDHPISMEQLIAWNTVSQEAALFLEKTGAGRVQTFLSAAEPDPEKRPS